jgi:hypothetical protein
MSAHAEAIIAASAVAVKEAMEGKLGKAFEAALLDPSSDNAAALITRLQSLWVDGYGTGALDRAAQREEMQR